MKANETNPPKPTPKAPSAKEEPKDDSTKAIADLGTKLGLAAMPLAGLAAGGKQVRDGHKQISCASSHKAGAVGEGRRNKMNGPITAEETYHISNIIKHYAHAREKHPYFCDRITCLSDTGSDTHLDIYRSTLSAEREASDVEACTVLECEVYEAMQAYTHGDTAHAVEECYDAIAVLLRTIDVLEGRQKLGKPEKGAAS